jgi:hypothetical protein
MTPTANLGGPPPDRNLVMSPDGTHVIVGTNGDLLVRALDQLEAVAVPGVTNARSPSSRRTANGSATSPPAK